MINCILGTRAQLIKMLPLIKAMEAHNWPITLIHTGQHVHTMQEVCRAFGIKTPWHHLYTGPEINTVPQALYWVVKLLIHIMRQPPSQLGRSASGKDLVVVHGDTFSTVLGALIGKRARMPVAHIESGLRSFNIWHPFPEELNRLLTFRLTDIAFCPGSWACTNLQTYSNLKIIDTGSNTLVDTLKLAQQQQTNTNNIIPATPYAVCSIHRFENLYPKANLTHIVDLLTRASQQCRLVLVLHPSTEKRLNKTGLIANLTALPTIELRPRMPYVDFVHLLTHSEFVLTDGGSNQEELAYLGVPTFLMRKATERLEGLERNIVLGQLSATTLDEFLARLTQLRTPAQTLTTNPCEIIMQTLAEFTLA